MKIEWLDPWLGVLALPLLAVWLWRWRRPRAALPAPSLSDLGALPRTLRTRLVHWPLHLRLLALLACIAALCRPVTRELLPMREVGVDLVLAIDLSGSMQIQDMDRSTRKKRVTIAKEQALAFNDKRPNDRVAVISFAMYPELRCPLTLDVAARAAFLNGLSELPPPREEDGTAVGATLARAVTFLEKSAAKSKVVVLLTDGEETVNEVPPADAAKLAKDAGIRVHTIGIGRGTPVPDVFGGVRLEPLDFKTLQLISETTGGKFFEAKSAEDLGSVYEEIDQMEKVQLEDPRYRTSDWFVVVLAAGGGLLLLALLLEWWLGATP